VETLSIYLAGQISTKEEETYLWRKRVREHFKEVSQINVIDPCNNGMNKEVLNTKTFDYATRDHINIIVPKDNLYVDMSQIIFFNMNQYDLSKPLMGTLFEMERSNRHSNKTKIGIYNQDEKDLNFCHPFIQQSVHTWVKDEQEACALVEYYFGDVITF